jgi:hypothetical protein
MVRKRGGERTSDDSINWERFLSDYMEKSGGDSLTKVQSRGNGEAVLLRGQ